MCQDTLDNSNLTSSIRRACANLLTPCAYIIKTFEYKTKLEKRDPNYEESSVENSGEDD